MILSALNIRFPVSFSDTPIKFLIFTFFACYTVLFALYFYSVSEEHFRKYHRSVSMKVVAYFNLTVFWTCLTSLSSSMEGNPLYICWVSIVFMLFPIGFFIASLFFEKKEFRAGQKQFLVKTSKGHIPKNFNPWRYYSLKNKTYLKPLVYMIGGLYTVIFLIAYLFRGGAAIVLS